MAATLALFVSVFLACTVEAVEALTVVLAVGVTRGWRSSGLGVLVGLAALAVIVAIVGSTLTVLPLWALRLIVGALLLVFGLQWLRKAILRAAGRKALHNETALFATHAEAARARPEQTVSDLDAYAFVLCCKAVLLEGLEVVFIVVTFGANAGRIRLASIAASTAVLAVAAAGYAVRGPLSRVPENQLKFVVGVLLTSFGMFWGGEGAGVTWPGADAALPVLMAFTACVAISYTLVLRSRPPRAVVDGQVSS